MKVVTICGTRPEWIRLSRIIPKLDSHCDHVLVDTGQNYDPNLRDIFLTELGIREPDYRLGASGSFGDQLGIIASKLEKVLLDESPDAFLVLGDTNSSLGAIIAKRLGIRVFHMEAGNRCFDERVPEEVNRRIIDHCSDVLMPYTERSRQNLLDEGIHSSKIFVTGNPIKEVMDHYYEESMVEPFEHYLVTLHRQENVDDPERLAKFIKALNRLDKRVIWPVHPRTRKHLTNHKLGSKIELKDPIGFINFIWLEKTAFCVLTDSGTVQEECAIFAVPVVTLRDTTERPETVEVGSNFIAGCEPEAIHRGIEVVTTARVRRTPPEYLVDNVSDTVVNLVLGYYR